MGNRGPHGLIRRPRVVAVGLAAVGAAAVSWAAGAAQTGQAPPPPNGALVAPELRLVDVEVLPGNLEDDAEELAIFRFSAFIVAVEDPGGLRVVGYNAETSLSATDASIMRGSESAVLARFPPGTDLAAFSIGVAQLGSVVDETGRPNTPSSARLEGSRLAGFVPGPELVGALADETLDRVTYEFDADVERGRVPAPRPAAFGLLTSDGLPVEGRTLVDVSDRTVTVGFDRDVADAVAFTVEAGTVDHEAGDTNPRGRTGGSTTLPDVVGAELLADRTSVDITFDRAVVVRDLAGFAVHLDDGSIVTAHGVARPAPEVVRIGVPVLVDQRSSMTLAVVEPQAAAPLDHPDLSVPPGVAALRPPPAFAGRTSGPDVVAVEVDPVTGEAIVGFDEDVDDRADRRPDRFRLVLPSGELVPADVVASVIGDQVVVLFPPNAARAAVALLVEPEAVTDHGGRAGALGLVDIEHAEPVQP